MMNETFSSKELAVFYRLLDEALKDIKRLGISQKVLEFPNQLLVKTKRMLGKAEQEEKENNG